MLLVKHVYEVTMLFPKSDLYGLTSQMRRAAVSIPANIKVLDAFQPGNMLILSLLPLGQQVNWKH